MQSKGIKLFQTSSRMENGTARGDDSAVHKLKKAEKRFGKTARDDDSDYIQMKPSFCQ